MHLRRKTNALLYCVHSRATPFDSFTLSAIYTIALPFHPHETGTINRSISGPTQNQHQHQPHITQSNTPRARRKEQLTPTPIIPLKPNRITPLIQRHRQRTTHRRTPHSRHKRHHIPHAVNNHIRIPLRTIPINIRNPNRARRRHRARHIRERQTSAWRAADVPDVFGARAAGAVEGFGARGERVGAEFGFGRGFGGAGRPGSGGEVEDPVYAVGLWGLAFYACVH